MSFVQLHMHPMSCCCCCRPLLRMPHRHVAKQVKTLASQKRPAVAPYMQGESSTAKPTGKERLQAAIHRPQLADQPRETEEKTEKILISTFTLFTFLSLNTPFFFKCKSISYIFNWKKRCC